jgi:DNA invertase Pin-like site-specific DNA recombinase
MSDDEQVNSIDRQRSQVDPFAAHRGYGIVAEYIDEGIPGDEVERRPGFLRLLKDAQKGAFDVILCDDRDRFGRFDSIDYGYYVKPLRDRGVWLETLAQGKLDWTSFAGRLTDSVQQEAKQMEVQATSRRVLTGFLALAKKGRFLGSPVPYGYRLHVDIDPRGQRVKGTSRLVPGDPHEIEVVLLLFRLYGDDGLSLDEVCQELYRRGIPTPRGRARWCKQTVQHILTNRRYVGDMPYNEVSKAKYTEMVAGQLRQYGRRPRQQHRHEPEDFIIVEGAHESLIKDRDLFERVQGRLLANRREPTGNGPERPGRPRRPRRKPGESPAKRRHYALSRLLVCGHCGARMAGYTAQNGRPVYRCSTHMNYGRNCSNNVVREDFIKERIVGYIEREVLDPDGLARLHERRRAEAERLKAEQPSRLASLRRQAAELTRKIDGLTEKLALLDNADPDGLRQRAAAIRQWREQREAVEAQIAAAVNPPSLAELDVQVKQIGEYLYMLREVLESGDPRRVRLLLGELVDRIEVYFTVWQCPKQVRSKFDHGILYVRPQVKCVASKTQGRL